MAALVKIRFAFTGFQLRWLDTVFLSEYLRPRPYGDVGYAQTWEVLTLKNYIKPPYASQRHNESNSSSQSVYY